MECKFKKPYTVFDSREKIWKASVRDLTRLSGVSLGQIMLERLLKTPQIIGQICANNGKQYTNNDIATLSIRVAQHLEELQFQQEDIIGICARNTDFIAPLVIGAHLAGLIVSTVDTTFEKDDIQRCYSLTQPKIVFCDGDVYEKVKESLEAIKLNSPIYIMYDYIEGLPTVEEFIKPTGMELNFVPQRLKSSSQICVILCSSGTTGPSKGVCLSHESIANSVLIDLDTTDKYLCFSSLYWASGYLSLVRGTIRCSTRVITNERFSSEVFLRLVEQYGITTVLTPPSQLGMIVQSPKCKQADLSSLRVYICTGSAVPMGFLKAFKKLAPNCNMVVSYGMTEVGGACSFGVPTQNWSNGHLTNSVMVKILDESGRKLGVKEQGEICIKQPCKWAGYYRNPEATKTTYDDEGWVHSGDIGYFDEDGVLFVVNRKKDILKYNNFHIFPGEIEQLILELPDVAEVCVFGIPDVISTYLPAAAVVKLPDSKLSEDDVQNYVAEKTSHFKHLRGGVYFLDSLPKTASGKIIPAKVVKIVEKLRRRENSSF